MKLGILNTLRWIAVYPICVVVYVLGYFIMMFANTRKDDEGALSFLALIAPLISSGMASFFSTQIAYHIAPNNKHFAVGLLFIMILCLIAYEIYLMVSIQFQWGMLQIVIGNFIGGIAGLINDKD